MAATRLIALHVNKGKTIAQTLADRTGYSKNEEKTEDGKYISSFECDARTADEEFLLSKRQYEHMTGRRQEHDVIAYQIRQSFKPGEVTPEEANKIGYELGMRFTKGKHAFIVATHTDRAHIHNHIIFNSTSLDCTRKFRNFFLSGLALQKVSDRLCLEHGLSIIEPRPYRERKKRTEYPKRPSIRCKGHDRFARFSSLGEGYTVDDLRDAIAGKRIKQTPAKSKQVHDKKFSLLIDIQEKLNAGKGTGYQRWATLFNLKQMAQVMCFLQENEINDFDELAARAEMQEYLVAQKVAAVLLEKEKEQAVMEERRRQEQRANPNR